MLKRLDEPNNDSNSFLENIIYIFFFWTTIMRLGETGISGGLIMFVMTWHASAVIRILINFMIYFVPILTRDPRWVGLFMYTLFMFLYISYIENQHDRQEVSSPLCRSYGGTGIHHLLRITSVVSAKTELEFSCSQPSRWRSDSAHYCCPIQQFGHHHRRWLK